MAGTARAIIANIINVKRMAKMTALPRLKELRAIAPNIFPASF
jgi:hypothetical protein